MKVQYFGDVSDYRKYALLRAFARAGLKLGVCWVMTESDGRSDGNFRAYIEKPDDWRAYDPELFDFLCSVQKDPEIGLGRLEAESVIPGACYFNERTPDDPAERERWRQNAVETLAGTDLVFFDPDNGFEIASRPRGRKHSSKFIFFDEVADHYREGRSVLVYQHFPRKLRDAFISELANKLRLVLPGVDVWAFKTAHAVFMLGARPEHQGIAAETAEKVKARLIPGLFRDVERTLSISPSIEERIRRDQD